MKRIYVILGLIAALIAVITILNARISSLQETVSIQAANIKAYQSEVSGLKDDAQTYQYTIAQAKASRDTMVQRLDSLRRVIKIKDKNLKSMSYIQTTAYKADTLYLTRDKYVVNPIDTTIGDDWFSVHLDMHDSTLVCEPSYRSELAVIASYRKETINPPSKVFFIRWFQKKHKVITVDVIEQNPYAKVERQKFIEIVK